MEDFKKQKYTIVEPKKMIKFCNYYLMYGDEDGGMWFRGRMDDNGNYEFDCGSESLEEIVSIL